MHPNNKTAHLISKKTMKTTTIMQSQSFLVILYGILLSSLYTTRAQTFDHVAFGVFKTSAIVSMEVTSVRDPLSEFSAEDLFRVERTTSLLFEELMTNPEYSNEFQGQKSLLETTFSVTGQTLISENSLTLESEVTVLHVGDKGILDLAALLLFLTNKDQEEGTLSKFDQMFVLEDKRLSITSFKNSRGSEVIEYVDISELDPFHDKRFTKNERTLIAVTSVLALALFGLSIVLIWMAGGWLALRKQVKVLLHREEELTRMTIHNNKDIERAIERQPTKDTDQDPDSPLRGDQTNMTNPSGILGVNPYYGSSNFNDMAVLRMTPDRRGDADGDDIATPMSAATTYSDTGRAPIGITSMRKLLPGADGQSPNPDQIGSFGIKRLEY